ncbi:HDIG domain-containing protein [Carboxydothermus islandicus]|uniref:HDIG domain-containing protein n=1 Tax=Carboxydothermus islandicus TaxID=661089 RepID=A0A1L8D4N4_9THEO|nr:HD-GYP domain-containing protein [Carboxydothermus islandicus]GAV26132.1 HDIG domain-containing protein [Carboxydothermus islandicus]
MRRIPVEYLIPGLKVGYPVMDGQGRILINAGTILTSVMINRLKKLKYSWLYIYDGRDDFEEAFVISEMVRRRALNVVNNLYQDILQERYFAIKVANYREQLKETAAEMLAELLDKKGFLLDLYDIRNLDDYTYFHSVNVALLSMATALKAGFKHDEIINLGISGLLHDIGKTQVPWNILNKPGKLSPEEMEIIRLHPEKGGEIVSRYLNFGSSVVQGIIQHHERLDGSGYLQGLSGDKIHKFAKIIMVADVYDAMTSKRVYRDPIDPKEVYEFVLALGGGEFDLNTVKSFASSIAVYPVGAKVLLNNGLEGIVTGTPVGFPDRPVIRVIADNGRPVEPYYLSLAEEYKLMVTKIILYPEVANESIAQILTQR